MPVMRDDMGPISNTSAESYVADAVEVVEFKLIREKDDVESATYSFKPAMAHQVFGDSEKIFGYKNLQIKLYYTAGWFRTYVQMKHDGEVDPERFDGVPPDNVMETLSKFLGYDCFNNLDIFLNCLKHEPALKPFGELISKTNIESVDGSPQKMYETFHLDGDKITNDFVEYYDRIQPVLLWFIDAANFIDTTDPKWNYFTMYEKYTTGDGESAYALVGVCTVYVYYAYPNKIRPRISQMLLLPPFQKRGLGTKFLLAIDAHYASNKLVADITVESPSPEFQRIRDYVDYCRCAKLDCFAENFPLKFTPEMAADLQERFKINRKQALRLYEIFGLFNAKKKGDDAYKTYCLAVKRRLNAPMQRYEKVLARLGPSYDAEKAKHEFSKGLKEGRLQEEFKQLESEYEAVINRYEKYGGI